MGHDPKLESELSRELSLFQITMMGLGMMIGAGVFVGIGNSIGRVGPGGVMLTFALNGVLAILTAMSYAELSSAIPRAGGAYNFARLGFGRGTSFVAGWMEWFASSVAGSLYAVTFSIYVVRYICVLFNISLEGLPLQLAVKLMAFVVAAFFIYINYRGASETGRVGAFFTLGQTLFLLFIGVMGVVMVVRDPSRLDNFKDFMPRGWLPLLGTMGFTYVAFEGFEVIAQAGDEVIDPRRNLPKAMLYSVGIVTFTYVAVAFASVIAVKAGSEGVVGAPWEWIASFKERGFGEAVSRLMPAGNFFLTLAVIFASTSALNATIYSATRASYALGRDRMLPAFFARISKTKKTPWVALLFTGGIVVVVATALPTAEVASSASIMFLFLFFLVNICVIKIRRNMGDELTYGFQVPLFPILPIIAILCQGVLAVWLVHMSPIAWIIAPGWIFCGALIYRFYSKSRVTAIKEEISVLEEEMAPVTGQYRIMVSVANPDNALSMVRHTYRICGAKDAQVELLHMVPVPDQVPLSDAGEYMMDGKEAIGEAMLYLSPMFPLSTTIRYCRNVARGIVSAVRERKADTLIMGWHGRTRSRGFILGSTVDPIIERVPCNVVIFKNCGDQKFKRVLVPVAGGLNAAFALEMASILADPEDGEVVAFTVNTSEESVGLDLTRFIDENMDRIVLPRERLHQKSVSSRHVVAEILKEIESDESGYDLVVMGCTHQPLLRQITRESVPETIAKLCVKPLVMVKASGGIRKWIRRWI